MVAFWRQSQDSLVVSLALNATSTKVSVNNFGVVSKRCHHLHIMDAFQKVPACLSSSCILLTGRRFLVRIPDNLSSIQGLAFSMWSHLYCWRVLLCAQCASPPEDHRAPSKDEHHNAEHRVLPKVVALGHVVGCQEAEPACHAPSDSAYRPVCPNHHDLANDGRRHNLHVHAAKPNMSTCRATCTGSQRGCAMSLRARRCKAGMFRHHVNSLIHRWSNTSSMRTHHTGDGA